MKSTLQRMPHVMVIFVAMIFTVRYFATAIPRLAYPYDLDFLEDSVLMEALQVANNQPVYVPPNADFNPHVYMPLFFWIGGLLFKLGGPNLLSLRLISLTATLVTTFLIYSIAKRESGFHWIAISCAGLYLGGYSISGFWYELARVDSLFVTLILCGMTFAIYAGGSNGLLVLSAVFLAFATFTKQTGFVIGTGITFYLLFTSGRRACWFGIPFAGLTIIPFLTLNMLTKGWFFYHILHIGSADPIQFSRLIDYFKNKILGVMAVLSLMVVLTMFLGIRRIGLSMMREQPWLAGIGMAIAISGMGRIRVGGNLNNLMPVYAFLCLSPALLIRESTFGGQNIKPISPHSRNWALAILILIQFALGRYSPSKYIPTVRMRQSADHFIQRIASIHGPVLVMMHPYYALLAGKDPSTQIATLWYVRDRGALPLPDDFVNRVKNHFYSAIISDESFFETQPDVQDLINAYYYSAETLDTNQAASTDTGVVVRPKVIYLPCQHQDMQFPDQAIDIRLHDLCTSHSCCSMTFQGGVN